LKPYTELESHIRRLESEIAPVELTSAQITKLSKFIDNTKMNFVNWVESNFTRYHDSIGVDKGFGDTYDGASKYINDIFNIVSNENLSWSLVSILSNKFDQIINNRCNWWGFEKAEQEYQRLRSLSLEPVHLDEWSIFNKVNSNKYLYHHDDEWFKANSDLLYQYKKALKSKIRHDKEAQKQKIQDEKVAKNKALASAYQDKTRDLAASVKNKLKKQLVSKECPYCGNSLGEDPHADHIYPVAEGGLSTIKNMVYICKSCNMKKRDKTLRQFIFENNMDREFIENNLSRLDKKF
jgi:5-methylcytosine-specific restriction endonuclease McrA